MSKADGYAVTEIDIVIEDLQRRNKYRPDLLYRGFDGDNIEKLLRDGQDTEFTLLHGATEKEIRDPTADNNSDPCVHASQHSHPALVVFDLDHLEEYYQFAYTFKNPANKPAALVAVYRLQYDK